MGRGPHLLLDVENAAVASDIESPPRRHSSWREHTVRARHRFGRIAQNRIVDPERRRKLRVRLRRIDARREITRVESPQRRAARPERLALRGSTAGERLRKPGDDDDVAGEVAEPISTSVRARQRKVRRGIARLQINRWLIRSHRRMKNTAGDAGHRRGNRPQHFQHNRAILVRVHNTSCTLGGAF